MAWVMNLNGNIKVKLNDKGKDIFYHQYDDINEKIKRLGGKPITPTMPKVDENGYTTFQMWQFINLYGQYIHMASEPVLESLDIIICDGIRYEEKEEDKKEVNNNAK